MDIIDLAVERYAHDHTSPEPAVLQELAETTRRERHNHGMLCGRIEGRFLKLLAQISGAKRVLELGLFTGYSALSLAEGLPDDGEVITCDIDPAAKVFAEAFFARSPHGRKIQVRIGPALETLASLTGTFDLAFIDADKENYPAYYQRVVDLLRPGGVLCIDNSLRGGQVLDPQDAGTLAIHQTNTIASSDPRVEHVLLTIRDGVHLIRKR